MGDLTVAYVTLGAGVVLLALVVLRLRPPMRRFTRANAALRADVQRRVARLRALAAARTDHDAGALSRGRSA